MTRALVDRMGCPHGLRFAQVLAAVTLLGVASSGAPAWQNELDRAFGYIFLAIIGVALIVWPVRLFR